MRPCAKLAIAASIVLFPHDVASVQYLVQYKNSAGLLDAQSYDADGKVDFDVPEFNVAEINVTEVNVTAIVQALLADPDIVYVERDKEYYTLPTSDGESDDGRLRGLSGEVLPYGIAAVQADSLWSLGIPEQSVGVCVIDTGMDDGHEDLPNSIDHDVTGTSSNSRGEWYQDGNGHGSHCAGTISAIGDNGRGVVGIKKNPEVYPLHIGRGLDDSGKGSTLSVLDAARGCYEAPGVKVISMSLGSSGFSNIENDRYQELYDEGYLIVAAAGNSGDSSLSYPASYRSVISVAAVDSDGDRASFSQCNRQVEIAAPGVGVLSTFKNGGYSTKSGTSMACPHVAGVAALVWSHFPNCTNNQIRNVLLKTAKDRGPPGCDYSYGHGIIQGQKAYDLLKQEGCEAGGEVTAGAIGGCEQSPDYKGPVPAENQVCHSAAHHAHIIVSWSIVSLIATSSIFFIL